MVGRLIGAPTSWSSNRFLFKVIGTFIHSYIHTAHKHLSLHRLTGRAGESFREMKKVFFAVFNLHVLSLSFIHRFEGYDTGSANGWLCKSWWRWLGSVYVVGVSLSPTTYMRAPGFTLPPSATQRLQNL